MTATTYEGCVVAIVVAVSDICVAFTPKLFSWQVASGETMLKKGEHANIAMKMTEQSKQRD